MMHVFRSRGRRRITTSAGPSLALAFAVIVGHALHADAGAVTGVAAAQPPSPARTAASAPAPASAQKPAPAPADARAGNAPAFSLAVANRDGAVEITLKAEDASLPELAADLGKRLRA